jgi:hypothetical protein
MKNQNLMGGFIDHDLLNCFFWDFKGNGIRIRIDISKAITPPNLFGIARKIV